MDWRKKYLDKIILHDVSTGIPLPDDSVDCVVTSPPYFRLREYGVPPGRWPALKYSPLPGLPPISIPEWSGCLGLEENVEMFVGHIVYVFRDIRRVLKKSGTLWLNLGDSYNSHTKGKSFRRDRADVLPQPVKSKRMPRGNGRWGGGNIASSILKPKDLFGVPWRVAFALQADGWWLRSDSIQDIIYTCPHCQNEMTATRVDSDRDFIWHKTNGMQETVQDRPIKSHEYIFLLSRMKKYFYDYAGANKRSVWNIATQKFPGSHFATFPEQLVETCILAGCPERGIVLDPFMGSGTTARVARRLWRHYIGFDIKKEYIRMADRRQAEIPPNLFIDNS